MRRRRGIVAVIVVGMGTVLPLVAFTAGCRKKPMMTRQGCEAVRGEATAAMQTLDATYNLPRTCVSDADCVELPRPSCISFCSGMAFPAKDAAMIRQRVAESEARECKHWEESDCPTIDPRPVASCARYVPRCQDTKCTMVYP